MKLISAKVERYRIHASTVVEFHDNPILIGGPNETGKSTLIEAIHRALFFRHNAGGTIQSGMVSTSHGGVPTVEVTFEAGGETYRLVKGFNGPRGTVTLAPGSGKALAGDEAEEELARILSTEGAIGGGGAQRKLATQWAHLWIWQGRSGEDPAGQVAPVGSDLIQRLQESGGAVAQQSPLDAKVAQEVAESYESSHTRSGSPRAGSPLDEAGKDVEAARAEVESAKARIEASRSDADKVVRSREAIERHNTTLADLRAQLKAAESRQRDLEKLQSACEAAEKDLFLASEDLERRRKTEKDFVKRRTSLEMLRKRESPTAAKRQSAGEALKASRTALKVAQAALEKAGASIEKARIRRDLAEAFRRQLASEKELADKAKALKAIDKTRRVIATLHKERARHPELTARDLKALRKAEQTLMQAESTLEAIATDIELLEGNTKIVLGERELDAGKRQSIDEPTKLAVGKNVLIRITPGGGKDLDKARKALNNARASLRERLGAFNFESVEEAAKALARRDRLSADIQAEQNRLDALNPEATAKARDALSEEFDKASSKTRHLLGQVSGFEPPADPGQAEELLVACETHLDEVKQVIDGKRAEVTAQERRVQQLEEELEIAEKAYQEIATEISHIESALAVLVEQYGNDKQRTASLRKAEAGSAEAALRLEKLRKERESLKPDLLEADLERLQRSLGRTSEALQGARDDLAGAEARLQSDGRDDPAELLAIAEARLRKAGEAYAREERVSKAITLLHETFKAEQQALSEQFSKPLADRINTYLQALFGPRAQAVVTFEDNHLTSVELVREGHDGSFPFDALSGGTREQVASAVRLAIAELLAADFDGTLPVVFDDAFANSDPRRIRELQRMLDLGARKGLQIIILTCTPDDYAALGADFIELG